MDTLQFNLTETVPPKEKEHTPHTEDMPCGLSRRHTPQTRRGSQGEIHSVLGRSGWLPKARGWTEFWSGQRTFVCNFRGISIEWRLFVCFLKSKFVFWNYLHLFIGFAFMTNLVAEKKWIGMAMASGLGTQKRFISAIFPVFNFRFLNLHFPLFCWFPPVILRLLVGNIFHFEKFHTLDPIFPLRPNSGQTFVIFEFIQRRNCVFSESVCSQNLISKMFPRGNEWDF